MGRPGFESKVYRYGNMTHTHLVLALNFMVCIIIDLMSGKVVSLLEQKVRMCEGGSSLPPHATR